VAPHRQPAYAALCLAEGALPLSERLHAEVLSLPMGPTQTAAQTRQVIAAVKQALAVLHAPAVRTAAAAPAVHAAAA
jgi:dTDP-4-amino-4,6-dideoxygalactose transaminase